MNCQNVSGKFLHRFTLGSVICFLVDIGFGLLFATGYRLATFRYVLRGRLTEYPPFTFLRSPIDRYNRFGSCSRSPKSFSSGSLPWPRPVDSLFNNAPHDIGPEFLLETLSPLSQILWHIVRFAELCLTIAIRAIHGRRSNPGCRWTIRIRWEEKFAKVYVLTLQHNIGTI